MADDRGTSTPGVTGRASSTVGRFVHRVPFTTAAVSSILVVGLLTGSLWHPLSSRSWFPDIAYGVPALREGKLWTLVTGWFFALSPTQYVTLVVVALVIGWCELRIGTLRTVLVCVGGQLVGEIVAALAVMAFSHTDWEWASAVAEGRDVGIATAAVAASAALSATVRSPWRLRLRAVLLAYVAIAFLFEGKLADVQHLAAAAVLLVVGEHYLSRGERGYLPRTRREVRLLAFLGLLLIGVVEVAVAVFPGDGPLGPTGGDGSPWWSVTTDVVVVVLVANQLRKGRNWAWWVTVVFGGTTVLATGVELALVIVSDFTSSGAVTLGTSMLWLVELGLLLTGRPAFRVPRRRRIAGGAGSGQDERTRLRALLRTYGGSTMSWMTTWPENKYFFGEAGDSVVTYQRHAGTVIVLADPVCPPERLADVVGEFTATVERDGLVPCLFSVTGAVDAAARVRGWRGVQIAEDTIVDLPGLVFKGKAWQDVRSAINRAGKEDVSFRLVTLADEPASMLAQVRAISEQWVGDKDLPEMGFTLGGVEEALDPAVRVGLAVAADGTVHGVTSWLPVHGPDGEVRGWTLDVMRRRDDRFRPVIEFLIASSCLAFQKLGAQFVSLSGAPLARSDDAEDAAAMDRLLETLGGAMEPYYGFRSLHAFKKKFKPRYEPVYLCFRDEADLPRIGLALARAYLPGVGATELLKLSFAKP